LREVREKKDSIEKEIKEIEERIKEYNQKHIAIKYEGGIENNKVKINDFKIELFNYEKGKYSKCQLKERNE